MITLTQISLVETNSSSGSGTTGPTLTGPTLTGNIIWVDSINGNDGTGARGKLNLPFLTLGAASAAANSGDTIMVLPGSYTPTTNINKTGVTWNFIGFPTITYNPTDPTTALFDLTAQNSLYVCGNAIFSLGPTGSPTGNGILIETSVLETDPITIFFECHRIITTNVVNAYTIYVDFSSGGVSRIFKIGRFETGGTCYISDADAIVNFDFFELAILKSVRFSHCTVDFKHIICSGNAGIAGTVNLVGGCLRAHKVDGLYIVANGNITILLPTLGTDSYCTININSAGSPDGQIRAHLRANPNGGVNYPLSFDGAGNITFDGVLDASTRADSYPVYFADNGAILKVQSAIFLSHSSATESLKAADTKTSTIKIIGSAGSNKAADSDLTIIGTLNVNSSFL